MTTIYYPILLLAAICWTSCGNDKAKGSEASLKEMREQLEAKRNELSDKKQIAEIEAEMKELDKQIKEVNHSGSVATETPATEAPATGYATAPSAPSGAMGTIAGLEVVMRAEASVQSDKITNFNQGEQVTVLETKNVSNDNEAVLTKSITLSAGMPGEGGSKLILPKGKAVVIDSYNADKNQYTISYQDAAQGKLHAQISADALETITYSTWYRVKRRTGQTGWVLGKFLKPNG